MADSPLLGTIFLFAGNFAPRGYALCAGQLLPISQNSALFAILGTTYGGNGTSTFALPDLRGRAPIGAGAGPGVQPVTLGQISGANNVTLLQNNLPAHTHLVNVNSGAGTQASATNNFLATTNDPGTGNSLPSYMPALTPGAHLNTASLSLTGSGNPVSVQNPILGITYIIAVNGVFPSRN